MKNTSREKGMILNCITIWCISLCRCRKRCRFQMQRQQWTRNGKKLETIPAWDVRKVRSKKEVIKVAQKNNNKVHFASLMDLCHLKNSELEPQFQSEEFGVGATIPEVQRKSRASRRRCERRLRSPCSLY